MRRTIQITDEADGKLCEIVPNHLLGDRMIAQRFMWAATELHRLVNGATTQAKATVSK